MAEAKRDSRVVGIHAAMGGGTGMNRFEKVGCFYYLDVTYSLSFLPEKNQ